MFYVLIIIVVIIIFVVISTQLYPTFFSYEGFANTPYVVKNKIACMKMGLSLNDMNIYLINLAKNKERLEYFIEQYMMSDLRYKQFKRFDAVDGKSVDLKSHVTDLAYTEITDAERTGFRTKHYQLTRGAVGCYLSHIGVYELIANGDQQYGFIFEDDVTIDSHLFFKLNKVLGTIPNDWDILLLGCYCIVCDKYDKYYDTERFFLLHSYIVKKQAAIKIVGLLKDKKIKQQIDSELSDIIVSKDLKVYCLKDAICKQGGAFTTTIQTPVKMLPGINPFQSVH